MVERDSRLHSLCALELYAIQCKAIFGSYIKYATISQRRYGTVKMHHMHFQFDSIRVVYGDASTCERTFLCAYLFHSIFGMERIAPATRFHFMTPDLFLPHPTSAITATIFRFRSLDLTPLRVILSFSHFFYAHAHAHCTHVAPVFSGNSRKAYEISAMHTFSHSIFAFKFLHFHFNWQYHACVCVCC